MEFVFFKSGNKVQFLGLGDKEQFMSPYSPCNNSIFSLRDEKGWNFLHDEIWISHVRLLANLVYPSRPEKCGELMDQVRAIRKSGKSTLPCVMPYRAYIGPYPDRVYQAAYHLMQYPSWDEFLTWPHTVQGYYLNSHTWLL